MLDRATFWLPEAVVMLRLVPAGVPPLAVTNVTAYS
jgi:hypothetical protein